MNDFARSVGAALSLIGRPTDVARHRQLPAGQPDGEHRRVVDRGALGVWLTITRFRGRQLIIVLTNALLGLPPVVMGLALYLLLSRSGPLILHLHVRMLGRIHQHDAVLVEQSLVTSVKMARSPRFLNDSQVPRSDSR